jgi:hypothetical protein
LPVAAGVGAGEGLAAVAFGGCAVGAGGAAEGGGAAVASAPHCALRKSFHFMPPSVPASLAALYFARRASRKLRLFALCSTATRYSVVDHQHHHRAHDCDDHAVNVQACDSGFAEQIKEKTADESADDSKSDVEPETV